MTKSEFTPSPAWNARSKRLVVSVMLVLLALGLYLIRSLLIPVILAIVVAYVVEPLVKAVNRHTRLSRTFSIGLVYLAIVTGLLAIPISTIPAIIKQGTDLVNNTPLFLQRVGEFLSEPWHVAGFTIPFDQYPVLDQVYVSLSDNVLQIAQSVGRQSVNVVGSVAGATLTTVAWIIVVLVLSFYMVKDHQQLWGSLVHLIPVSHQGDIYRLGEEMSATWNAFLRGQLILCLAVGTVTFVAALIVGLPNALVLALIAGIAEFVPNVGPTLAAVPAFFVALFQNNQSWLGSQVSPLGYAGIILLIYILIQQVENILLVPRIIGRSLNLHPFVVFLGAIGGASIAGILGILLAAPLLASARLIFLYIFRKLSDVPPFPLAEPAPPLSDIMLANPMRHVREKRKPQADPIEEKQ